MVEQERQTPYQPGELRIVRDVRPSPSAEVAYNVEETAAPHFRQNTELLSEKVALALMRYLGSPYPGQRYPDDPWAYGREQARQQDASV